MKTVQIYNVTKGVAIAQQAKFAATFGQRLKGLLGRSSLPENEALILKPCTSIHTFFMRFAIDVLFLGKDNRIVKLVPNIPPNRLSPIAWASQMAIELPAGKIAQTGTQLSDAIEFK